MGAGMGLGGRGGISLRNLRTFTSFKNRVYRLFYGSLLAEQASQNMHMMTRSLLVYRLTGSAAILGVVSLAHAIPMLFFSLFGGVIADRVQKKYVLIAGHAGLALVTLVIGLTLTLGYLSAEHSGSWWILVFCALFQGTVMSLKMPSRQAIIPEIVGEEQLMNAVSLNIMGMNFLRLFAPALSGFLIDAFDFDITYYIQSGLYLVALVFIAFMPPTGTITVGGRGALVDIKEGILYIRHETTILLVLVFTTVAVILSMPYMTLLPIFTEDILKVGASGLGVLLSVSGIGAIAGSLTFASLPNKNRGIMMLVSCFLLGLGLTVFSFSSSWHLSLAFIVLVGLGQAGRMTLGNALLQYYSVDEYRGRVMSFNMMEFGIQSLSTFGVALLTEAMGVQWAVGGFAMALVVVAILTLIFVPSLRKLD